MALLISKIMEEALATTTEKGFRDQERPLAIDIALMHSELSEALEEDRDRYHDMREIYYAPGGKVVGVAVELADAIIRICESCEYHGIPLETAIIQKLKYNKIRPYKHGGKRF